MTAALRSPIAPWLGGLSAVPVPLQAGFSSPLWWLFGSNLGAAAVTPPAPGGTPLYPVATMVMGRGMIRGSPGL